MAYHKRTRNAIHAEKERYTDTVQAYVERLAQLTDEAAASREIGEFLSFLGRFHRYSAANAVLIRAQKPTATWVAGYNAWKRLGRWPRASTGIKIFAPTHRRVGTQLDEEGEERPIHQLCGFHLTTVFDVSDTEGEELPPVASYWVEESDEGAGLYGALVHVAEEMGIVVSEDHLGLAGGVSYGGRVEINVDNATLARTSSLAHEIAHELLHQGEENGQLDRRTKELEAEAVAYVVCSHFGHDVKAPQYIALWQGDSEGIMARLESIRRAASRIISEVERHASEDEEENPETPSEGEDAPVEPLPRVWAPVLADA